MNHQKNEYLKDLHSLVSDTLLFLTDHYPLQRMISPPQGTASPVKIVTHEQPKPEGKLVDPPKNPSQHENTVTPLSKEKKHPELVKPTLEEKKKDETMLRLMADHLAHLTIAEEIPKQLPSFQTIILVSEKKELPFLQNLAKAIKQHFCPVKLIDMQKIQALNKWEKIFSDKKNALFLLPETFKETSPKELKGIFLAETHVYTENIERKKQLWSEICQILKPSTQK